MSGRHLDREAATLAAERLKLFAQPLRLMILSTLVARELSVGAIDEATGIGQPALSQQLAALRRGGLVSQRREAKQVLYRLIDERTTAIVRFVHTVFGREGEPEQALRAYAVPIDRPRLVESAAMFPIIDED